MYSIQPSINGKPTGEIIAQSSDKADIIHLWVPGKFALCWSEPARPVKHWPEASVKSYRRKKAVRRIEKKFPLFAEQFTEEYDAQSS